MLVLTATLKALAVGIRAVLVTVNAWQIAVLASYLAG